MSIGLYPADEVQSNILPVDNKGTESLRSQQGDRQIDRLRGGRRGRRASEEFGQFQRAPVSSEEVPTAVDHECRIRLMLREHEIKRAVDDCQVRRRKVSLTPKRRISGREHQRVLLA